MLNFGEETKGDDSYLAMKMKNGWDCSFQRSSNSWRCRWSTTAATLLNTSLCISALWLLVGTARKFEYKRFTTLGCHKQLMRTKYIIFWLINCFFSNTQEKCVFVYYMKTVKMIGWVQQKNLKCRKTKKQERKLHCIEQTPTSPIRKISSN
jgi:hypothetical protein